MPTWHEFKSAVRKVDRDSLLVLAAGVSAAIARDEIDPEWSRKGLTAWNVADVARTALAWARFQHPGADEETLLRLCNKNALIVDERLVANSDSSEYLGQVLARAFFEQFPNQNSAMANVSRSILLFGSGAEYPPDFSPSSLTPGWFEAVADGISVDDYIEAVFLISVMAQTRAGSFSLDWLDGPEFEGLDGMISFDVIRRVFNDHLVTTAPEFKAINQQWQADVPAAQKKFAFNPLLDKPFISGVAPVPIAPSVQAIMRKASPPAIYHFGLREVAGRFTTELGPVFQHYVGRHLKLVQGAETLPEFKYGPKKERRDSCDWFLDLPGMLVLIECKARQPIESLRLGSREWMAAPEESIGHAVGQLNMSNINIDQISAADPRIDAGKRRVGLIVTLEPFYVTQNWLLAERLAGPELPVAAISVAELEHLVVLDSVELEAVLGEAADRAETNLMRPAPDWSNYGERENALIASTWESIGLFSRVAAMSE
ncbi:hypothetical protein SAMN04489844_1616 [Nocardioides exalbidus]|uniref:Uncharacterized protein n=2 Tax=Nocardioides exalbidus TaxID=402596 RepID=A0A1H4PI31_9ACTN|nr:hypothetical protein SAMN04489844_1616 [Nocardioides exalbidus]